MDRKLQVLIVDDEENIREGLKYLIDWEANGYSVMGTAKNGEEAYYICRKKQVDIVLTDIRMPVMDGLMLSKKLYEEMCDIVVIIMSAYKDFSYAQEAIRYHVQSYILKPINGQKLCEELQQILEKSSFSEKRKSRREDLLKKIMFSQIIPEESTDIFNRAEELGMELKNAMFQCMQIRWREKEPEMSRQEELLKNICIYMEKERQGYGCLDVRGNMVLLLVWSMESEQDSFHRLHLIKEEMNRNTSQNILVAVGQCVKNVWEICKSYRQTNNMYFLNLFQNGENTIFCEGLIADRKKGVVAEIEKLFSFIYAGQLHEIEIFMDELGKKAINEHMSKVEMYGIGQQIFGKLEGSFDGFSYGEVMEELMNLQTISDMIPYIKRGCLKFAAGRKELSGTQQLIKNVEDFIEAHISDFQLNTKYIAQELGYNSAYMGRVFLNEKEISVKEFINNKRIGLICRRLTSSNEPIAELAYEAGYQDISTFYEIFKKIKKTTPREYREINGA